MSDYDVVVPSLKEDFIALGIIKDEKKDTGVSNINLKLKAQKLNEWRKSMFENVETADAVEDKETAAEMDAEMKKDKKDDEKDMDKEDEKKDKEDEKKMAEKYEGVDYQQALTKVEHIADFLANIFEGDVAKVTYEIYESAKQLSANVNEMKQEDIETATRTIVQHLAETIEWLIESNQFDNVNAEKLGLLFGIQAKPGERKMSSDPDRVEKGGGQKMKSLFGKEGSKK